MNIDKSNASKRRNRFAHYFLRLKLCNVELSAWILDFLESLAHALFEGKKRYFFIKVCSILVKHKKICINIKAQT